jgi:protocatechuate 3,4-dioxygenase beta subunit
MNLLWNWHKKNSAAIAKTARTGGRSKRSEDRTRRCRFEMMEERRMMDADPIRIGVTYLEQDGGSDLHPDQIQILFEGGAPGTELTHLEINGDRGAAGLSVGDMIFDTAAGGWGADEAYALKIVSQSGIQNVAWHVVDGTSLISFDFQGFHAGDKLIFSIDVDEIQEFDPLITDQSLANEGVDPIASGVEFQGSQLDATFHAPHYYDVGGTKEFRNLYEPQFAGSNLLILSGNADGLPDDNYQGQRDRSTGVMLQLQQQPLPVTIAGKVYLEHDLDLVQDSGEPGIANVALGLWQKVNGSYVFTGHTTTTDSQGNYQFGASLSLLPGIYQVRETQPTGLFSVGAIPGTVDGAPTGSTVAGDPDQLTDINIPLGDQHGIHYDFAEAAPASISGRVHLTDREGNCFTQEALNRPLAGVSVKLFDAQGNLVQQVLTNANGEYSFTNLRPGMYSVVEQTPAGLIDGGDHIGTVDGVSVGVNSVNDTLSSIFLGGGASGSNYDFCEHEPADIAGYVYHDANNNGVRDNGEAAIPGTTVILLDVNGTQVASQVTNASGFYKFSGLQKGNYSIVEVQPSGYIDGKDAAGTILGQVIGTAVNPGDKLQNITLLWGDSGINYNFGELKPGSLSGHVYVDADEDCVRDPGETPLAGVTIQLFNSQGTLVGTTQTNAQGFYQFNDLAPGTYVVKEQQPAGYLQGGQVAGSKGGNATLQDAISQVPIASGDAAVDYDFCELLPVSIEGFVFADRNQNCVFDAGESPIAGVTMRLFDQNGNQLATTLTDAQGNYKFTALKPGEYTVKEQQPAGYFDGGDMVGSHGGDNSVNDVISQIKLHSGDQAVHYDFCEVLPVSIQGFVWVDTTPNCQFDPGEAPIAGVTIQLFDLNGNLVSATQTNAQGSYQFNNLQPGTYTVKETQPTGYLDGGEMAGSHGGDDSADDVISAIQLNSGDAATDYDFCEVPPATLSGYVFRDGPEIFSLNGGLPEDLYLLRDGKLTPDDIRLGGVWLELRNTLSGELIRGEDVLPGFYPPGPIRVQTDANGYYEFKGLPAGNYSVFETQPDGFIDSLDTPGTTSGLAVNRNTVVSPLTIQTFAQVGVSFKFDAILQVPLAAGQQSTHNNFSEVQVLRFYIEPPPPGSLPPGAAQPYIPLTPQPIRPPNVFIPTPAPEIVTGGDGNYTWHLSIVDAGTPRVSARSTTVREAVFRSAMWVDKAEWQADRLRDGIWSIHSTEAGQSEEFLFGLPGAIAVTGDWNGDGRAQLGIYYKGEWFLDLNGNGRWDEGDLWAKLGSAADLPVVGDWDGDGKDDIGIFGPEWAGDPRQIEQEPGLPDPDNIRRIKPKNLPPSVEEATDGERLLRLTAQGKERADLIDHVFQFGGSTDVPIAGDWNGDGISSIGIFRDGKWHFDMDGDGRWSEGDKTATFGQRGDIPVVGDFDGDGIDEIGIYRSGKWIIDSNGNRQIDPGDRTFELGAAADQPVVGDFNGDGVDEPQLHHPAPESPE